MGNAFKYLVLAGSHSCPARASVVVGTIVDSTALRPVAARCGGVAKPRDRTPEDAGLSHQQQKPGGQADMKLIMAIIKPFKLDDVREALTPLGVQGLTVSEVKGFGRQKGQTEIYRGAEYHVSFLPKIKIEVVVPEDLADQVIEAISKAAHTGKIGDGKIFVLDIERAMRIRTGEIDSEAL
jgi:nitrogen regulatory protein P-II 2